MISSTLSCRLSIIPQIIMINLGNVKTGKIAPELAKILSEGQTANTVVSFDPSTSQILAKTSGKIKSMTKRPEKLFTIANALKDQSRTSQEKALVIVQKHGFKNYNTLWISNQLYVHNATKDLATELSFLNEVTSMVEDTAEITYGPKIPETPETRATGDEQRPPHPRYGKLTWGLEHLKVPEVWAQGYYGQNVIVAHIDSGVAISDANRDNFMGFENFGWFHGANMTGKPRDPETHGTHTMGTISGQLGIGVAPGSRWMTCSNYLKHQTPTHEMYELSLMCFQHFLCPGIMHNISNDCAKSPQVISNSYGVIVKNESLETAFLSAMAAFKGTGTFIVFAVGNSGPMCSSIIDMPQMHPTTFSVGAINYFKKVRSYSSAGPANDNKTMKPDVVAPGRGVLSIYYDSLYDHHSYKVQSGTSMSTPHVAGVIALMLSKNPNLSEEEISEALRKSAEPVNLPNERDAEPDEYPECTKIPLTTYPNYRAGYGMVNALKAVNFVKSPA